MSWAPKPVSLTASVRALALYTYPSHCRSYLVNMSRVACKLDHLSKQNYAGPLSALLPAGYSWAERREVTGNTLGNPFAYPGINITHPFCYLRGKCSFWWNDLTHWSRMTHICVNKLTSIGSDNGLSPNRRQAIIWTNAEILLIWNPGNNLQWNLNGNLCIFI